MNRVEYDAPVSTQRFVTFLLKNENLHRSNKYLDHKKILKLYQVRIPMIFRFTTENLL